MDPAAFHFLRLVEDTDVDLSTIANVATALTVITGVAFGLVEAQRSRRARQERAAYAAVQALLSPEWMKSMITVHSIPDGSNASAIVNRSGGALLRRRAAASATNLEIGAHEAYRDWEP